MRKPSLVKFPLVFPAYDRSYLNKLKIYTESSTGRGSSSRASHSFMPGLFITMQKLSLSIIHLWPFYGDHLFDVSPKSTEAFAAREHLQDEIYDAVINLVVYLKINTSHLLNPLASLLTCNPDMIPELASCWKDSFLVKVILFFVQLTGMFIYISKDQYSISSPLIVVETVLLTNTTNLNTIFAIFFLVFNGDFRGDYSQ